MLLLPKATSTRLPTCMLQVTGEKIRKTYRYQSANDDYKWGTPESILDIVAGVRYKEFFTNPSFDEPRSILL